MLVQPIEKAELASSEAYQLIKDEQLHAVVISSQVLAGSRVLLSTYKQVVFSECVFYACDFQGVTFENCIFENCSFEFSHIKKCHFNNCNFTNCNFTASTSTNSSYINCDMDLKQQDLLASGRNNLEWQESKDYTTDIYIEMAVA